MMNSNSTPLNRLPSRPPFPSWSYLLIGLSFLAAVSFCDATKVFGRAWSFLYFVVALYGVWLLRGRGELALDIGVTLSTFLVPILFRPEPHLVNRTVGSMVGWGVILVMRDRRRFVAALQKANDQLEDKIKVRTAELQSINQSLCLETSERERIDRELRESRLQLDTLSRQLIAVRETELQHLARELHDEFGQVLTAMKMNLRGIQRTVDEKLRENLETNISMIDRAVGQVRAITLDLRPPQLGELGLAAALHWFLKHNAKIAGFQERITVVPPEILVPSELAIVCYRIAQEAVNNAIKHAEASRIEVDLRHHDGTLYLTIRDDGAGFDSSTNQGRSTNGSGLGLVSMRERALLATGKLEIESNRGKGTAIHARFPLPMKVPHCNENEEALLTASL